MDHFDYSGAELFEKALDYAVAANFTDYFTHLFASADKNHEEAIMMLVKEYENGGIKRQNHNLTKHFYETFREQPYSCFHLGFMSQYGLGVDISMDNALIYYHDSVEKGCKLAMVCLSKMYEQGNGVQRDYRKSQELLRMAHGTNKPKNEPKLPEEESPEVTFMQNFINREFGKMARLKIVHEEEEQMQIHLTFKKNFNLPIKKIPAFVTHVTFGVRFNKPIGVDTIAESVTHLFFGVIFNQPITWLPSSLTFLKFGDCFDQPLDHLPSSITHLVLGHSFNHPISGLKNVTHLIIGHKFDQYTENFLPESVIYFEVRRFTDQATKDRITACINRDIKVVFR